jgi:Uncharacterized protein conserved in bacteria
MSNVDISVGGRNFRVACADGEEARILRLGRLIDAKVAESGASGQTEGRMLLYASLLLADELDDLTNGSGSKTAPSVAPELEHRLNEIAEHIEKLADLLERGASIP